MVRIYHKRGIHGSQEGKMARGRIRSVRESLRFRLPSMELPGTSILQALCVIMLVLNLLMFYAIFYSDRGLQGYQLQSHQVSNLTAKVQALKQQNKKTFNRIQALKNDPRTLEKIVRHELGWTRENELVFEFVPPKKNNL
jgi:cell division protein FtsB